MTGLAVLATLAGLALAAVPWCVRRSARELAGRSGASRSRPAGARAVEPRPRGGAPVAGPPWRRAGARPVDARRGVPRVPGVPWRRRRPAGADPALLLDLVAVALAAGAPVPTAVAAVGEAWPGATGVAMGRAARALTLGAPWDVAWAGAPGSARALAEALEPAWRVGASPVPLLRAAAERTRSRRRAQARAAAGRLGVQLVVPLALCFLPAFVLVGLVPVVVSLAARALG